MDTFTQALLGGAVGYAVAGRKSSRKALLVGAAIAVLPDLDIFIPYENDLDSMTFHRSWSHSWLVQSLLAPLIALLIYWRDQSLRYIDWWLVVWLALITHSALDALTVYGTQIFWPFMPHPASGGSIFIIDPIYSLLLLGGFLSILFFPLSRLARRIMLSVTVLSTLYLLWGLIAQFWIAQQTRDYIQQTQLDAQHFQVSAAPLNTLLWRIVIVSDTHYYQGFRSVFDGDAALTLQRFDRGLPLINALADSPDLQRFNWFTRGLFKTEQLGDVLVASDLRMGMEPDYFFRFALAKRKSGKWLPVKPAQLPTARNAESGLKWVWQRIWAPQVNRPALLSDENTAR
ncbi:putative membrane-bound metal-dependent hydrolase [Methylophaga frappieri]|uniref:Putative membrane-bound metal-dependent hydrolase n=1 Tax=Methylophaga frappieri (strain ATCC BAA-2434 / DSM 25690 / JAM7) TaxID=754477 RepID=I1YEK4_METFJ|nr:metal-dependent hydrolase [Methylophaga frappieri]AFJ01347.1 putative membrane-bound metal-dependent hydrolase [Methylophaga frappieri]